MEFNNEKLLSVDEERFYAQKFKQIWDCTNLERRSKIFFPTLNQEEEKIILADLINYMLYYFQNKRIIDKYLLDKGTQVDVFSIVDFWYNEIGKSKEIESILLNLEVFADCITYFEEHTKYLQLLSKYFKGLNVYRKEIFRTEETANYINKILNNSYYKQKKSMANLFHIYNVDANHISEEIAQKIIIESEQE